MYGPCVLCVLMTSWAGLLRLRAVCGTPKVTGQAHVQSHLRVACLD